MVTSSDDKVVIALAFEENPIRIFFRDRSAVTGRRGLGFLFHSGRVYRVDHPELLPQSGGSCWITSHTLGPHMFNRTIAYGFKIGSACVAIEEVADGPEGI